MEVPKIGLPLVFIYRWIFHEIIHLFRDTSMYGTHQKIYLQQMVNFHSYVKLSEGSSGIIHLSYWGMNS